MAQFERDGFVLPASLVMRAARQPTAWKAEFLPALLQPRPRPRDYFAQPAERLVRAGPRVWRRSVQTLLYFRAGRARPSHQGHSGAAPVAHDPGKGSGWRWFHH